jgi:hypothetical protein
LKNEVLEQSENLFRGEKNFQKQETFNSLVERLKEILRRLSRLDSFVSSTLATQPGEFRLVNKNINQFYAHKPLMGPSVPQNYSYSRRALPSIS